MRRCRRTSVATPTSWKSPAPGPSPKGTSCAATDSGAHFADLAIALQWAAAATAGCLRRTLRNSTAMTDRYAVIGNPVAHSKSPLIHAAFARQTGQDLTFERILGPVDGFRVAVGA